MGLPPEGPPAAIEAQRKALVDVKARSKRGINFEALRRQEWEQQQQQPRHAEVAVDMQILGSGFGSNVRQMGGFASPHFQQSVAPPAVNRYHSLPHTPLVRGPRCYQPDDRQEDVEEGRYYYQRGERQRRYCVET